METPSIQPAAMLPWRRLALGLMIVLAGIAVLVIFRDKISLEKLAEQEAVLRDWYAKHPALVLTIAALIYLTIAALSVPVGTPLSLTYGWLFGFPIALVIVNCASSAGAVLAFWSSRYVLRDTIEHWFGNRLLAIERKVDRDGPFYLLALRLVPVFPFFIVNLALGLTRMRTRTFWWVSQLGMLPATCVYVGVGASVPSLQQIVKEGPQSLVSWQLIVALTLLGTLPLVFKKVVEFWQRRRIES